MRGNRSLGLAFLTVGLWGQLSGDAYAQALSQPLPAEPTDSAQTLPSRYPGSWVFVHDLHPASFVDGRVNIVDVAAPSSAFKGVVPAAHWAVIRPSTRKSEIYVAETFYSRGTRGERADVITIWDNASLKPEDEILLPGGLRGQMVTQPNGFQLTNDEKWGLVFNFTPASSVTVVDLDARKVLSTIDTPGCMLVYPTGPRGFFSLCADGAMISVLLDDQGKVTRTESSKPFNDLDKDALFPVSARIGQATWFVSFKGAFRQIDSSGLVARDAGGFSLPREKTDRGEWRPGGWQLLASDGAGRLFVLMNPDGRDGDEKAGGTEVWVIDPVSKARISRIALKERAVSIEATKAGAGLLVASRHGGFVDVYDIATGQFIRSITSVGEAYIMEAAR